MPSLRKALRHATLKDVAAASGLAVSSVSHILGGKWAHKYPEQTRQKAWEAARRLNYQPSHSARTMRARKSNLIGVINFGSTLEIAQQASRCLPREINAAGYDYLVVDITWYGGSVERVLNEMIRARVEGVIVVLMQEAFDRHFMEMFERAGIPVLSVFGDDRLQIPVVRNDVQSAHFAMARHLQQNGHRRLLMVGGTSQARQVREKKQGFRLAFEGRGPCRTMDEESFFGCWLSLFQSSSEEEMGIILELDMERHHHKHALANYTLAKRLMSTGCLPDAVLCSNDQGAFGFFSAAMEIGLRVPGDLAVTGMDNDEFGRMPAYGLTTIELDIEGACSCAVEHLAALIQKGPHPVELPTFATHLILRHSCGRSLPPDSPLEDRINVPTLDRELAPTTNHQGTP